MATGNGGSRDAGVVSIFFSFLSFCCHSTRTRSLTALNGVSALAERERERERTIENRLSAARLGGGLIDPTAQANGQRNVARKKTEKNKETKRWKQ